MRTLIITATAAVLLFVGGANAKPTAYQNSASNKRQYGYSEQMLDSNKLRVSFNANDDTDRQVVEMYLMYRAAETTLQRGFDWFVIVNHDVDVKTEYQSIGHPLAPIKTYEPNTKYRAVSDIVMYRGVRPEVLPNAFDARTVQSNLQVRVFSQK